MTREEEREILTFGQQSFARITQMEIAVGLIWHNQIFPYEKKTQQVIEYLSFQLPQVIMQYRT